MTYQMKVAADDKIWYQLQWNDIEFKDFEEISSKCNSIEELKTKISRVYPDCNLTCTYLGKKKKNGKYM